MCNKNLENQLTNTGHVQKQFCLGNFLQKTSKEGKLLFSWKFKPETHGPQHSPECTAMKAIFSKNTVNVACKKN